MKINLVNIGQLAAKSIYFYYIFKNGSDEAMDKKDVENKLLDQKPIHRERLLLPNERMLRSLTIDRSVFLNYGSGSAIYLHILVQYKYAGGDDELEGRYVGIFKLQKSTSKTRDYSIEIEREWSK